MIHSVFHFHLMKHSIMLLEKTIQTEQPAKHNAQRHTENKRTIAKGRERKTIEESLRNAIFKIK